VSGEQDEAGAGAGSADGFWRYFHELYEALPRQGPGERGSTERALGMLPRLGRGQRLLDVGCGSGTQTLDLARATEARIVAVDNHPPFVERLARRVAELGLGERVTTQVADMNALPFTDGSFDVVWAEGSIFVIGFAQGLSRWRRLLGPGGHLVVSELCWLTGDPPSEVREFFAAEGAKVEDVPTRRRAVDAAGYHLVGDFVLPATGWWENYYVPLAAELERFRARHGADPLALAVAERSEREIDVYRRHPGAFGYAFFVLQRPERDEIAPSG